MASNNSLEFFRARADQARADADEATLTHVRERCLRSEAAWMQLADRAARSEDLKLKQEKIKADQSPPGV